MSKKDKKERKIWYSNLRCHKCNVRLWVEKKCMKCPTCGYQKPIKYPQK